MQELVLITGASAGLGAEMARALAARKFNLVLVARNQGKLEALKNELQSKYGIQVNIIVKDLTIMDQVIGLYQDVKSMDLEVTMLVNNAGVGVYGNFEETALEEELNMIDLNISALVALSKLFLQDMLKRNHGSILNIGSILSFLPFPYYSVYSSTKAFVLFFSETLQAELEHTNIRVSAFCPGPIDTGFTTPEMFRTNAYKANKPVDPKQLAQKAVQHLLSGKGTKIPGFNNWFIANTPRFSPRWLTLKITKFLASRAK